MYLSRLVKKCLEKQLKKAAKKGAEKAVTTAATKTGEYASKKAGDTIFKILPKVVKVKKFQKKLLLMKMLKQFQRKK